MWKARPVFGPPRMPGIGAIAVLLIAVAYLVSSDEEDRGDGEPSGGATTVAVTSVVDGDTVHATIDGVDESIRYIGIDTPEVDPSIGVECFGEEASARNKELVGGERVRLVFGAEERDRYGRLLAYVFVGDELINAELVRGGYAQTLEIEPNTDRAALFERLEREAASAGRGLWEAC